MVMTIGKYVLRYIGSIYISGQPMDRKLNDKQCVTRRINQDANITRYPDIFCMRPIVLANSYLSWIKNRKEVIDFSAMLLLVLEGEKKSGKLRSL